MKKFYTEPAKSAILAKSLSDTLLFVKPITKNYTGNGKQVIPLNDYIEHAS